MGKVLTKEIAEQFLKNPEDIDLSLCTSLEDSAAKVISKLERGSLQLDGISKISDSAASFLSQFKGRKTSGAGYFAGGGELSLGLTDLNDNQAKILSKIHGIKYGGVEHQICFVMDHLKELNDSAAKHLSKLKADLYVDGLSSISNSVAESLSNVQGELSLSGLNEISDIATESLSKHKGTIHLDGIRELSISAAKSLAKHCGSIWLRGLKTLTEEVAESLSYHKGPQLTLGIKNVSDLFAESFSKYQGRLSFNEAEISISYYAAESLSKCNEIVGGGSHGQNAKEWAKEKVLDIPHDEKLSIMRQKAIDLGYANKDNVDSVISGMSVDEFQQLRGILRKVKRKDFC